MARTASPHANPRWHTEPAAGDRRRVLRVGAVLVGVAAVLFAVGIALGLGLVGRHGGGVVQGWDDRVQAWDLHHRFAIAAAKVVAFLGDAPKLAGVVVVLTGVLLVATRSVRALVPIVAYLGGELQVFLLREVIHRHRPPTADYPAPGAIPGVHETSFSFPSGHSVAVTAVLFGCLGAVAIATRWWWPWVLAAVASLYVIDTRLDLGVHWFSDVTVGLVLGVGWGIAVAVMSFRLDWDDLRAWVPGRRTPRSPAPAPPPE
jgi:membrane-associated phospholipid phosphatase